MAEFLIFIRSANKKEPGVGHWMDDTDVYLKLQADILTDSKLSTAQQQKNQLVLMRKYEARHVYGDIIETHPDGWFADSLENAKNGLHWFHEKVFAAVKVPNLKVDQSILDSVLDMTDPERPIILKRKRFNVARLNLVAGECRVISRQLDWKSILTDKAA